MMVERQSFAAPSPPGSTGIPATAMQKQGVFGFRVTSSVIVHGQIFAHWPLIDARIPQWAFFQAWFFDPSLTLHDAYNVS